MLVLGEVSIPESGVRLLQDQVVAFLNDSSIAGEGMLAVAESNVTWISRSEGKGFSLSYPSIIMHAVSTDCSSFPREHVLVVVDAGRAGTSGSRGRRRQWPPLYTEEEAAAVRDVQLAQQELTVGDNNDEDAEEESEDGNLIIRFVPSDMSALEMIYKEMAECQELNPEEEDMEEDEEEEEMEGGDGLAEYAGGDNLGPGWYTSANLANVDDIELSEEGRANLQRMMANMYGNGGDDGNNGHNGHHDEDEEEHME